MALSEHHYGPFTAEDVRAIPDDCFRYELLDGTLLVSPAPSRVHQRALSRLLVLLAVAGQRTYEVLPAPFDWKINDIRMFEPDLVVIRADDPSHKWVDTPPCSR